MCWNSAHVRSGSLYAVRSVLYNDHLLLFSLVWVVFKTVKPQYKIVLISVLFVLSVFCTHDTWVRRKSSCPLVAFSWTVFQRSLSLLCNKCWPNSFYILASPYWAYKAFSSLTLSDKSSASLCHEGIWGRGGIAACILNLGARWTWLDNFMP